MLLPPVFIVHYFVDVVVAVGVVVVVIGSLIVLLDDGMKMIERPD